MLSMLKILLTRITASQEVRLTTHCAPPMHRGSLAAAPCAPLHSLCVGRFFMIRSMRTPVDSLQDGFLSHKVAYTRLVVKSTLILE